MSEKTKFWILLGLLAASLILLAYLNYSSERLFIG
jgi:hypothetical protein